MKAIKRILHFKLSSAGPPKVKKLYCRYPGCGKPFRPKDRLDEFCTPECLRDFNYTPPAHLYPPLEEGGRREWWRPRRSKSDMPQLHQRPSPVEDPPLDPDLLCWENFKTRFRQLEANIPPEAYVAGTFRIPPPRPPHNAGPASYTVTVPPPAQGRNAAQQPVPVPKKRLRTRAHNLPRPPSTKFRNRPLPPIQPPQSAPPVPPKDRFGPLPLHTRPANVRRESTHPTHVPPPRAPTQGHSARARPNAHAYRGPRPRSNSFGGYQFPRRPPAPALGLIEGPIYY
ncbi:hypothetical protein C8Q77DRAFT_1159011 [Trametes polyzona]|nr:hypothetical protein C8Q77DRAFT_1159011 [Trametes polyzona]